MMLWKHNDINPPLDFLDPPFPPNRIISYPCLILYYSTSYQLHTYIINIKVHETLSISSCRNSSLAIALHHDSQILANIGWRVARGEEFLSPCVSLLWARLVHEVIPDIVVGLAFGHEVTNPVGAGQLVFLARA